MPVPVTFDFHDLVDGVIRNNVGVDAITVTVHARPVADGVEFEPSGQSFALGGPGPSEVARHRFAVDGLDPGAPISLRWLGAAVEPSR